MRHSIDSSLPTVAPFARPLATPQSPLDVVAELRRRLGADFAWFARFALVPGQVPVRRTPQAQPQLWVADVWSVGDVPGAAHALDQFAERPLLNGMGVNFKSDPDVWDVPRLWSAGDLWWRQPFAVQVYLRHGLLEEHRFMVTQGDRCLGVLGAAWDERRVGAARRTAKVTRDAHGRWAAARLMTLLEEADMATARHAGEMLLSPDGTVRFASESAMLWLDDVRAERLRTAVQRETEPDPLLNAWVEHAQTVVCGAEVDLTSMRGPDGGAWLARLAPLTVPTRAPRAVLTSAQWMVASYVADGMSTPEVARRLGKSVETVRTQLKTVFTRLGVRNRLELLRRLDPQSPNLPPLMPTLDEDVSHLWEKPG